MSIIRVKCPNCGLVRHLTAKEGSVGEEMIHCDQLEGGCDQLYAVKYSWVPVVETYELSAVMHPISRKMKATVLRMDGSRFEKAGEWVTTVHDPISCNEALWAFREEVLRENKDCRSIEVEWVD